MGLIYGKRETKWLRNLLLRMPDDENDLIGERVFFAALLMGFLGFLCFRFMIRNTTVRVNADVALKEDAPKFNVIEAMATYAKTVPPWAPPSPLSAC